MIFPAFNAVLRVVSQRAAPRKTLDSVGVARPPPGSARRAANAAKLLDLPTALSTPAGPMKDRKIVLCAALIALVRAIPGRREEAGTQLPASEVDKMHAKPFDERSGRGSLLDRAKHEGDLRITIFPEVGMLSANDPTPTSLLRSRSPLLPTSWSSESKRTANHF